MIRTNVVLVSILLTVGIVVLAPSPSAADQVEMIPWPSLVSDADFVGVVDCVVAGGKLGKFKVVES
ncbi:hypothetical protein ACFL59_06335 [Planctomycetota bacterium]